MTGFGEARTLADGVKVAVEVRSINNRYFKLALKTSEGYTAFETEIENLVRQHARRGTVQVNLRVDRAPAADDYRINGNVLAGYQRQLADLGVPVPSDAISLLNLPGVVSETSGTSHDVSDDWPTIKATLEAALARLSRMREDEGRAMAADLAANCRRIGDELEAVGERAPLVADGYRLRLHERLKSLLADYEVTLSPVDLLKEVGIFAERSDISEEIVRLKSHLDQFERSLNLAESSGRKLEFVTQEMLRETNTIGSKANDVQIARHVIEMKSVIERIREMIQNVE